MIGGKPIIMLPELFASTMAGFYLILVPLISLYIGLKRESILPTIMAKMSQNLNSDEKFHYRFLPVHIRFRDRKFYAEIVSNGPSSLSRFLNSNGFILVPPRKVLREVGEANDTLFGKEEFSRIFDWGDEYAHNICCRRE